MKKELPNVEITTLDSRGRGRGSALAGDGTRRPVIVTGAYPGDVVDVRVRRRKAGAYLGEIATLRAAEGTPRRVPFCPHFHECGGCTVQDIDYADQLAMKEAIVTASFSEYPAVALPAMEPILPAPNETRYRNKLEFSFGAHRWLSGEEIENAAAIEDRRGLGFHAPGRFDRVIDLKECYLQPEPSESIRSFLRALGEERGYTFYDAREHHGLLRLLTIRTSLRNETMVIVMFGEDRPTEIEAVMSAIVDRFPDLSSVNYVINTTRNDSLAGHEVHTVSGRPWITEACGPNELRIRPKAFYQTNPRQAVALYERAVTLAGLTGTETALDLYCGIGSIALYVASSVKHVVGVEVVEDAVTAARENAELNGVENVAFIAGAVERVLSDVVDRFGRRDVVFLDPPRAGLHPKARQALYDLAPDRIVYISCNPRTQAVDINELIDRYEVTAMQPVDMFPQTRHVENIAVLQRR